MIYTDFNKIPLFKYEGIVVDPPWNYEMYSEKGHEKSPHAHYDCMSLDDLKSLRVADLCGQGALMIMWSTWPHMKQAISLMDAWGFKYVTGGSWHKKTKHGKSAFGTGYVLRSSCEPFLIGKLNDVKTHSRSVRNVIETCEIFGNEIEALRREHSQKPNQQYDIMEQLVPCGYCLEMFARNEREGWDSFGDEVGKYEISQAVVG